MNSEPKNKLTLEWVKTDDGRVALVFDARTWKVFEDAARSREQSPEHMILRAVTETIGPILADNYVLNRFLGR
jgi:hypothetical protein